STEPYAHLGVGEHVTMRSSQPAHPPMEFVAVDRFELRREIRDDLFGGPATQVRRGIGAELGEIEYGNARPRWIDSSVWRGQRPAAFDTHPDFVILRGKALAKLEVSGGLAKVAPSIDVIADFEAREQRAAANGLFVVRGRGSLGSGLIVGRS